MGRGMTLDIAMICYAILGDPSANGILFQDEANPASDNSFKVPSHDVPFADRCNKITVLP